jgi:endoglucanase
MPTSASQRITVTNSGDAPLTISSVTATGDFAQTNDYTAPLAVGAACHIDVTFTPTAVGARTGNIAIVSNDAASPKNIALSGAGIAVGLPRLSISGNQFVDPLGNKVRLKSVNWFGAESTNYIPHGCWARKWSDMLAQMKGFGFNCIRFAFSGDFCSPGRTPPTSAFDAVKNPEFVGKTSLQILDLIVDWCATNHVYIVLDHHRCTAGAGTDSGIAGGYTTSQWHADWAVLAARYANNPVIVGADVHNEPYTYTWADWATLAEGCGNAILAVAPDWLIFVEGVGQNPDTTSYWWGGALKGVATRPIVLSVTNKVVYSPHEYGDSVGSQFWLATDSFTPTGWPTNLHTVWRDNWGFIFETGVAPIWIGEMGGFFGLDGNGALTKPNRVPESTWMTELVKYLNGDWLQNGTNHLTGSQKGMSFSWWGYPPVSGDTGGLVRDDWITPQQPKLDLIAPLLV